MRGLPRRGGRRCCAMMRCAGRRRRRRRAKSIAAGIACADACMPRVARPPALHWRRVRNGWRHVGAVDARRGRGAGALHRRARRCSLRGDCRSRRAQPLPDVVRQRRRRPRATRCSSSSTRARPMRRCAELLAQRDARIVDGPNAAGAWLVATPPGQADLRAQCAARLARRGDGRSRLAPAEQR